MKFTTKLNQIISVIVIGICMLLNAVIQYQLQTNIEIQEVIGSFIAPGVLAVSAIPSSIATISAVLLLQLYRLHRFRLALLSLFISFGSVMLVYVYRAIPEYINAVISPSEGGNYSLSFAILFLPVLIFFHAIMDGGLSVCASLLTKWLIETYIYKEPSHPNQP